MSEALKVAEIFGEDVFNDTVMQERLPKKVYKDLKKNPKNFDPRNYVASIMDTITLGVVPDAHVQKVVDCMKDGVTESIAPLLVQFGSYRKSHLIEVVTCEQMAERYKKAGI